METKKQPPAPSCPPTWSAKPIWYRVGAREASDEPMSLASSTASSVNETLRMKWRHLSGRARLDSEIKVEAMKVEPLPSACFARRILGRGGLAPR